MFLGGRYLNCLSFDLTEHKNAISKLKDQHLVCNGCIPGRIRSGISFLKIAMTV